MISKSKSVKALLKAISDNDIKGIKSNAKKVIKEHGTLNLLYEGTYSERTPLQEAADTGSLELFQLVMSLGADPFFKPKPGISSVIEKLANSCLDFFMPVEHYRALFKWLMRDKESPVFNWEKLNTHQQLFDAFAQANLIPEKRYLDMLPLHVAIKAGRMDLVQGVLSAAGSVQKAGDICRVSILIPAVESVIKGHNNALEILEYLLGQGANTETTDVSGIPLLLHVIVCKIFYGPVKEDAVFDMVKLLLKHGAKLDVTNPNNGNNPLMESLSAGYKDLFYFLFAKADAQTLNHRASTLTKQHLIFQLISSHENRLKRFDILKFLPELKAKGADFTKTISYPYAEHPFGDDPSRKNKATYAKNVSLLHFYIECMASEFNSRFYSIDKHIEIIQTIVAMGVNPKAIATYTLTHEAYDPATRKEKKIEMSMELTAAEYARKLAAEIVGRTYDSVDFYIQNYPNEREFLRQISYMPVVEQTELHIKFHDFRNLERALSGKRILPYSGLPKVEKSTPSDSEKSGSVGSRSPETLSLIEDSNTLETKLTLARKQHNKSDWQAIKKSMVDYVKRAESSEEFLERMEEFKTPLQMHFDIEMNAKGEVINKGSFLYRLFHIFDTHKFPSSWETLKAFGYNTYAININLQYEPKDKRDLSV